METVCCEPRGGGAVCTWGSAAKSKGAHLSQGTF